jgi:hypothetical protein
MDWTHLPPDYGCQFLNDIVEHFLAISRRPLRCTTSPIADGGFEVIIWGELAPERRYFSNTTLESGLSLATGYDKISVQRYEASTVVVMEAV